MGAGLGASADQEVAGPCQFSRQRHGFGISDEVGLVDNVADMAAGEHLGKSSPEARHAVERRRAAQVADDEGGGGFLHVDVAEDGFSEIAVCVPNDERHLRPRWGIWDCVAVDVDADSGFVVEFEFVEYQPPGERGFSNPDLTEQHHLS